MKKTDKNNPVLDDITVDDVVLDDSTVGDFADDSSVGGSSSAGDDSEIKGSAGDDSDSAGDGSADDSADAIGELSKELIERLGFKANIEVTQEDGVYRIHIKTDEDASMLIGKHARMLSSLQRVMSAMLFNKLGEKIDILVDVNDYRDAQKERLIGIADSVAQRVIDEGRPSRLSSFSAYERKIIHEHISENYHSLESFSEGEGRFRKLVIGRKQAE